MSLGQASRGLSGTGPDLERGPKSHEMKAKAGDRHELYSQASKKGNYRISEDLQGQESPEAHRKRRGARGYRAGSEVKRGQSVSLRPRDEGQRGARSPMRGQWPCEWKEAQGGACGLKEREGLNEEPEVEVEERPREKPETQLWVSPVMGRGQGPFRDLGPKI